MKLIDAFETTAQRCKDYIQLVLFNFADTHEGIVASRTPVYHDVISHETTWPITETVPTNVVSVYADDDAGKARATEFYGFISNYEGNEKFNVMLGSALLYTTELKNKIILQSSEITLPSSAYWNSVCYGNGKYVAVAYTSNKAAYSEDGISWTETTMPYSENWNSVCYGDGKYVAVAYNSSKAAYSEDGISWTETTMSSSENWNSVCYGNGKYVAVAFNSNKAAYSKDGINWTTVTLPSSAYWYSVCYGDGKYVAVTRGSNKAAYSEDGINWPETTMPSSANWYSVCYGNGKYVAVAHGSGAVAYSEDGISWTEATLPSSTSNYWHSICYGNGKYVAVSGSKAAYSEDGINWTEITMPYSANWNSVCYGDGNYVAVAYTSDKAATLTDVFCLELSNDQLSILSTPDTLYIAQDGIEHGQQVSIYTNEYALGVIRPERLPDISEQALDTALDDVFEESDGGDI